MNNAKNKFSTKAVLLMIFKDLLPSQFWGRAGDGAFKKAFSVSADKYKARA
jgi:hypothetical protein